MSIERAQTDDIRSLTSFPDATLADTVADLRYMGYLLPGDDVSEILSVVAEGVNDQ